MKTHLIWTVLLLVVMAISAGQADAKSVNEEYAVELETALAAYESRPTTTIETPNLYVSAQRQSTNNSFGGMSVVEIIVDDPYIAQIYINQIEPNVTVNGAPLRMAQTIDGNWHAYVVESDMAAASSAVAFGSECSTYFPDFSTADDIYCNIRIDVGITRFFGTYMDAVRQPKDLSPYDNMENSIHTIYKGQIGIVPYFWPIIQAFDFEDGQDIDITYHERGGPQTIRLTYTESMDRYAESHVDRLQTYLPGEHVHMTIKDALLNIDPTDEDVWTFSTHPDSSDTGLYYQLYDEHGSRPSLYCPVSEVCRVDRASTAFGDAGSLTIYLEAAPNMMLVDNGQQSLTDLQTLSEYGDILQPLTFVETGPNTGVFTNTDTSGKSSLVTVDSTVNQTTSWEYAGVIKQIIFNRMPELDPVGNKTVMAQSALVFSASATDPDDDPLQYSLTNPPAGAMINANTGEFDWTPTISDAGIHTFAIIVSDGLARSAEIISVNVTLPAGANHPPVAPDITVTTDSVATVTIRPQIRDPDGHPVTITSATGATKGQINTAHLQAGDILYIPDTNARGTDRITYAVSDGLGGIATGTITVIITPNTPPTARDFGIRAFAGVPVKVNLNDLGAILDNEQSTDSLAVSLAKVATRGSVVITGTFIIYTANPGASGTDAFHYMVTDIGGLNDIGIITVTISESRRVDTLITDNMRRVMARAGEKAAFTVATTNATGSYVYLLTGQPAGAAITPQGDFSWTPTSSQTGTYNFTITVYDTTGAFDLQHVTITVLAPDNTPPEGRNIEMYAGAGTTASNDIADILYDRENDYITVTISRQPTQGAATAAGTVLSYAADSNAAGTDSFAYMLTDEHGASSVWDVMVRIMEPSDIVANPRLIAHDAAAIVRPGSQVTITPQISYPDGSNVIITSATGALKGSTVVAGNSIIYTPRAGQSGIDIVTYKVSDGRGSTATGTITIRIDAPNTGPALADIDDIVTHVQDTVVFVASADDPDDDALVFGLAGQPAGATINATTGRFSWTPASSQTGYNTFTVTVSDGRGGADSLDVGVTVHDRNTPPEGRNIELSVDAGMMISDDIADIIYDREDDKITVIISNQPTRGVATSAGTVLSYAVGPSAVGVDSFEYRLVDEHGASSVWTVTILIEIQQGSIADTPPLVPDIQVTTVQDSPATIPLESEDPEGGNTTVTSVRGATKGIVDLSRLSDGYILYIPEAGKTGIDTMNYTVSDDNRNAASGTITVYINEQGNYRPVLDALARTGTNVGERLNFTIAATDPDGDPLTFGIANAPQGATISPEGHFDWVPMEWQIGRHTVTITVHDGHGGGDWQDATILVYLAGTVNRDPTTENIVTDVTLGRTKTIQPDIDDLDGDNVVITEVSRTPIGSVLEAYLPRGLIVFTGILLGSENVTYAVSDGRRGSDTGTMLISVVRPTNLNPVLNFIGGHTINVGGTVNFTATARDIDDTALIFSIENAPAGASITPEGYFSWTPTDGDLGSNEITVRVSDGRNGTDFEIVTIIVREAGFQNSPPAASDIIIVTQQGAPNIARPGITDPDGDTVRITRTGSTALGEIVEGFLRAGILIYVPGDDRSGADIVNYTVSDGAGGYATATMAVFISAPGNTPPILFSVGNHTIPAQETLTFTASAIDAGGDTVSYILSDAPAGATISEHGDFSWTPAASDRGDHTFTIAAYDDRGGLDRETITVTVVPAGTG